MRAAAIRGFRALLSTKTAAAVALHDGRADRARRHPRFHPLRSQP